MHTSKVISRARSTLLTPRTEWPIIAAEPETVGHLYSDYILIMAAIPALVRFVSVTLIGTHLPLGGTYRVGIVPGLTDALLIYVTALLGVYIVAMIVEALAPTFSAEKNRVQAFKTVAYTYTASWVASILGVIPGFGWIAALVGFAYGIYLLRLALPVTMKCPDSSAVGYTIATIVVAIFVALLLSVLVAAVLGTGTHLGLAPGAPGYPQ